MTDTIRAVSFDLDYTLAVPDRDRTTLLDEATEAVGAPPISRSAYLDAHRDNLTAESRAPVFAALLDDDPSVPPERLAAAYREQIGSALSFVSGTRAMLADLRERYRVGILTNGPSVAQHDKIDRLDLGNAVDAAVVTGDLRAGKPDERAFAAVCDALGTPPSRTVHVGDAPPRMSVGRSMRGSEPSTSPTAGHPTPGRTPTSLGPTSRNDFRTYSVRSPDVGTTPPFRTWFPRRRSVEERTVDRRSILPYLASDVVDDAVEVDALIARV